MPDYSIDLDRLGASRLLLLTFLGVAASAWLLHQLGLVGWALRLAGAAVRWGVGAGFRLWRRLLSWAPWPVFLALAAALLAAGVMGRHAFPPLALACGAALLFAGVVTCVAYVFIDLERYEVARGYKAIHDPLPGQTLATDLVRHGGRVGVALLGAAAVGAVCGFALLNQGLYETVGHDWYRLGESGLEPDYEDFLAHALINLLGVVDVLNLAGSRHLVRASHVQAAAWPASVLLASFKILFTFFLLQQVFASVRQGKLLAETVADFWSPHQPIHERARGALPQHGPDAARALLSSLRAVPALTAEQREHLPQVIADVGPACLPALKRGLRDPSENVRAVALGALGRLHALDAVAGMVALAADPSEYVRASLAEALGFLAGPGGNAALRRRSLGTALRSRTGWLGRLFGRGGKAVPADPVGLAVSALRSALADQAPGVRAQAALSLGRLGPPAAPAAADLVALLGDAEETVRLRAVESLGLFGATAREAVPALAGLLAGQSAAVRAAAARSLGAMKEAAAGAAPDLVALLRDGDEAVRSAAADALGRIGALGEGGVGELTRGLDSPDSLERADAAEALGSVGSAASDAAPALAEALGDASDRVRGKAAEALGKMGEAAGDAVPGLVRALRDGDAWVNALAAEALGEVGGGADAVPALTRSLRHANAKVRANAAEALGKLGAAALPAAPALALAAQDSEVVVRAAAATALGEVGGKDEDAGKALLAATRDGNPEVRAAAVEALGKSGAALDGAAAAVLGAAGDSSDEVQAQAARALPAVAGPTPAALDALRGLLRDGSALVQVEAARALGRLGAEAGPAGDDLLALTRSGEEAVREQALRTLAVVQPPQAAEAFLVGLKDARPAVRVVASAGLIRAAAGAPDAAPALVAALGDPEAQVRANAARALSTLEALPDAAIGPLSACAGDPDDGVRLNAALALRGAPPGRASAAFRRLLADPTSRVRLLAAGSLLATDPADAPATAAVASALDNPAPRLRRAALELVGSLGRGAALLGELRRREAEEVDPGLSDLLAGLIARLEAIPKEEGP